MAEHPLGQADTLLQESQMPIGFMVKVSFYPCFLPWLDMTRGNIQGKNWTMIFVMFLA